MIEHVSFSAGQKMLKECYRVLKPGGRLRIVTPDIIFLLDLYNRDKTDLQRRYIEGATRMFIPYAPYPDDTFVINNFFRDWGHQFIYDAKTLTRCFSTAGFRDVKVCTLNESESPELTGLAHEDRYPNGFLRLESLIVEGKK
jgi:predicted SAM-dependent methyltransferase